MTTEGNSVWAKAHDTSTDSSVLLSTEHATGVWVVTMNDPETHNTLTPALMGALAREIDRLNALEEDKVKVIILNAAGKSFCAGIDINAIRDDPNFADYWVRKVDPFYALQESDVPVIACVQGAAMTGGFEIAMSCDIAIASSDAVFRDNHAMYGVHAIRGLSQLLPRVCGPSNAKLAILASLPIPAAKALAWHIVSEVTDSVEDLLPAAMRIADGLLYNNGPILRALKESLREGFSMDYGEAQECELKSNTDYFNSIGESKSQILSDGAARFNERVQELKNDMQMRGGTEK